MAYHRDGAMRSGLHRPRRARIYHLQRGSSGRVSVWIRAMGTLIIVLSPTRRQNVWNFPGKGKTKWTQSVDADGRSLRMDNSRGDSIFMKGMSQGLWQKNRDEQTGATVKTQRCPHRSIVSSPETFHPKHRRRRRRETTYATTTQEQPTR